MSDSRQRAKGAPESTLVTHDLKTLRELAGILDHLVVVRESSPKSIDAAEADLSQFAKMASHTIDRADVKVLPGAPTIKALAVDIVRNTPQAAQLRESLNAHSLYDLTSNRKSAVAYLIVTESDDGKTRVGWLLSVFSAAKAQYETRTDSNGNVDIRLDNAFTQILKNTISNYSVRKLHCGPFARIVRDAKIGTDLRTALIKTGTTVHFDGGIIGHGTKSDPEWQLQCLIADLQYKGVVKGLTMGTYGSLQSGYWPKAENQLPALGYKFRSETDPKPVPDETQRELVSALISWAANNKHSWLDIAKMLASDYGFASGVHRSRQGGNVTILDARHPEIAVKNILSTGLPLWLTGQYRYVSAVPRSMDLEEMPDDIRHAVQEVGSQRYELVWPLDFHHDLLSKPWADEATIKKAIRRLAAQSPYMKEKVRGNFVDPTVFDKIAGDVEPPRRNPTGRAAATRTDHKPLAGISEWEQGDHQWALTARDRDFYLLVNRPLSEAKLPNGKRAGWRDKDRNVIACLNPGELHRELAERIVDAIDASGVQVSRSLTPGQKSKRVGPASSEEIDQLTVKVEELDGQIQALEYGELIAMKNQDEDALSEYQSRLQPLRREHREVKAQLAKAQASQQEAREFDTEARAQLDGIAAALAALAKTEKEAPGQLSVIMRDILDDLRFTLSGDKLSVHFTVRVRVATDDGFVFLGPVIGAVKNHRRATRVHRRAVMFERMFKLGEDFQTAALACGYTDTKQAKKGIHDYLTETGLIPTKGLRAAALDCPLPIVRQILWAEHVARQEGSVFKVPDGVDASYAEHIRNTYTSERQWALSWMVDNPARSRMAIDMCLAAGDIEQGIDWDELVAQVGDGLNEGGVRYLKEELVRGKGATSDGPERYRTVYSPVLEPCGSIHSKAEDRNVRVRRCPYCDARTLTHIVRVPEVLGGLMCVQCRRNPNTPTVVFPEDYLRMWVGPRGVGLGKNGGPGPGTKELT